MGKMETVARATRKRTSKNEGRNHVGSLEVAAA